MDSLQAAKNREEFKEVESNKTVRGGQTSESREDFRVQRRERGCSLENSASKGAEAEGLFYTRNVQENKEGTRRARVEWVRGNDTRAATTSPARPVPRPKVRQRAIL